MPNATNRREAYPRPLFQPVTIAGLADNGPPPLANVEAVPWSRAGLHSWRGRPHS